MQIHATTARAQGASNVTASPIVRKSDMTGDPAKDLPRSIPSTLLYTDKDRALIEKVTGVKVDPETGITEPRDGLPESVTSFMQSIAQKRFDEYLAREQPKELSPDGLRDIFKQAIVDQKPLDQSFLQKALDWMVDKFADGRAEAETKAKLDIYA